MQKLERVNQDRTIFSNSMKIASVSTLFWFEHTSTPILHFLVFDTLVIIIVLHILYQIYIFQSILKSKRLNWSDPKFFVLPKMTPGKIKKFPLQKMSIYIIFENSKRKTRVDLRMIKTYFM